MTENEIGRYIIDAAVKVHSELGPGLLESVYEIVLAHELRHLNLRVKRQVPIAIKYKEISFVEGFKADLVVENKVIIELKCIEKLANSHKKQLLTYLRMTEMKLGYLLNFSESLMKQGIVRIVNGLSDT